MNITFINPTIPYKFENTPYLPLGIGYLVSSIQKECPFATGIQLVDGQILKEEEFWRAIESVVTDVVLISATIRQMNAATKIATIIKRHNEDVVVILGGPGPSGFSKLPRMGNIDIIVKGEAEEILPLILQQIWSEQPLQLDDKAHISYEENNVVVSVRELPDVDAILWPNRTIFDTGAYEKRWRDSARMNSISVIGSRGCPFGCIFCDHSVTGHRVRYRTVSNIAEEMIALQTQFKPDDIFFYDDLFTLNEHRVITLCNLLRKSTIPITWSAQGRVDTVTKPMLEHMRDAGCTELMFGVESGSDGILKYLHKGFTRSQIIAAFRLCHEVGIKPGAYIIIGIPGETERDIKQTISLIEKIEPSLLNISYLTPFPATLLFHMTEEIIRNRNYETWDDFQTSPYAYAFEVDPKESERLILEAYRKKIEKGMLHSAYQFTNTNTREG